MHMGSGGTLRVWKILDFKLPMHFNKAILAIKTELKPHWKSSITLVNTRKHHHWNSFILKEKHTALWGWHTIEPVKYFLSYWMRMDAGAQGGDILLNITTCS